MWYIRGVKQQNPKQNHPPYYYYYYYYYYYIRSTPYFDCNKMMVQVILQQRLLIWLFYFILIPFSSTTVVVMNAFQIIQPQPQPPQSQCWNDINRYTTTRIIQPVPPQLVSTSTLTLTLSILLFSSTADSETSSSSGSSSSSTSSAESPIDFVRNLLHQLSSSSSNSNNNNDNEDITLSSYEKGMILLNASSDSWRNAIYQAIGMTTSSTSNSDVATTSSNVDINQVIAKSLQKKMTHPNNQFAILFMGSSRTSNHEYPYTMTFPSDVVDYQNDNTVWVECQLRHPNTNELYVIMGIHLLLHHEQPEEHEQQASSWKIISLDWQDFREQFYPGVSGREWLRSF
jgi:hypothetical protein